MKKVYYKDIKQSETKEKEKRFYAKINKKFKRHKCRKN